uniref:Uncharacterized protein n=1 Tax=mine drainage metagenome TaxID=410659 RepID=E6QLY3_9ZZZZ
MIDIEGKTPVATFTAAAGQNYGFVAAYEHDGKYLILYGNNGETSQAICEDAADLAYWLESPDLNREDEIIQTANVRGSDVVEPADKESEGPFLILATHYCYGPTEHSHFVTDENGRAIEFDDLQAARAWITDEESGQYCLAHNEYTVPSYKIV